MDFGQDHCLELTSEYIFWRGFYGQTNMVTIFFHEVCYFPRTTTPSIPCTDGADRLTESYNR